MNSVVKQTVTEDIARRLLDTCHYLESVNAYLLGKLSLPELRATITNRPLPPVQSVGFDSTRRWMSAADEIFGSNLVDIDYSYMLGFTLEEIINAKNDKSVE